MVTEGWLTSAVALCLVSLAWTAKPFDCRFQKDGFYADPTNCRTFHRCIGGKTYLSRCPLSLVFHPTLKVCEWANKVDCSRGHRPSTVPVTTKRTPITASKSNGVTATSSPALPLTRSPAYEPSCAGRPANAMFGNPDDCSAFYWCVNGKPLLRKCGGSLLFNSKASSCDWPFRVDCLHGSHVPDKTSLQTVLKSPTTLKTTSKFDTTQHSATKSPTAEKGTITKAAPVTSAPSGNGCSRRVCYYTNWSQYRPGDGRFVPENVDPFLCTHVVYAFAKLSGNHLAPFEWNDDSTDWSTGMYERVNALKKINPNLKTLLAVGGWNLGSAPFTKMVATAESRQDFADHSVNFLKSRGFDGLDLDWEYPANRGSPPEDKDRFTLLVKQLRETYDKDAAKNGGPPLLLTSAVAAGKKTIDTAYDIPQLASHLDFISLMSYDLHGSWESVTGHPSGLYARSDESGSQRFLNVDWAARYWVSRGCPKHKLVIGIPTYARTFTLRFPAHTSPGAASSGAGAAGTYTRQRGFLAYYEVCTMVATADIRRRIVEQKVPYLVKGDQWVGYEDVQSVTDKVRYVRANGYGGVMTWSLPLDDFTGKLCGQGRYPLWSAVNTECQR